MELPPRARRIPQTTRGAVSPTRTTSACAENTHLGLKQSNSPRNYLRVRGEYCSTGSRLAIIWELPPRARRIPASRYRPHPTPGTTSACAENTPDKPGVSSPYRNYLRVRGEYAHKEHPYPGQAELPPRARRIHHALVIVIDMKGTTSACAENTATLLGGAAAAGNYLRVRGEYRVRDARIRWEPELPPRARRIHPH